MKKIWLSFMIFSTPIATHAAGFALIEQSASGMGNAFAGGGAVAEDASTIYFNPAGMTYIQGTQVVGAIHLIKPSAEFSDQGSVKGVGRPPGGFGSDAGDLSVVPNFYYKMDLTDTVKFGLGVNAPFGLKTEYDKDWIGRFQAIKSELKTVNINPAIAFRLNDKLSIGAGLSAMWAQAELTSSVNLVASERTSKVKGDDWGFGFNVGAIYQATQDTRLSIAYRSKIEQHLDGDVKFSISDGQTPNGGVTAGITLPETFSFSAFSRLNDKWDLMGDLTWTRWSQFQELAVYRDGGTILANTLENWDNTLRYSIGANYQYSDAIKLRAGLAYDQEAVNDQYRTARIPGNDRKWLSLGAGWQVTPTSKLDVGYAHLFISDAPISDKQNTAALGRKGDLIGKYDGSVDILSLQYTHNF
jgi:long-chain fatty acid transport protein